MNQENESTLSSEEKEKLKDDGQERALDGKAHGNSFLDKVLDTKEEQAVRQASFDHTKDVERDEETRRSVVESD